MKLGIRYGLAMGVNWRMRLMACESRVPACPASKCMLLLSKIAIKRVEFVRVPYYSLKLSHVKEWVRWLACFFLKF
jgi:hypothetical protein